MKIIASHKEIDMIQMTENQFIYILKEGKAYPPYKPLKTVQYKNYLKPQDLKELCLYALEQGYIEGVELCKKI